MAKTTGPDDVTAPAPDAVLFRTSVPWTFGFTYLLILPFGLLSWLLVDLMLDVDEAGTGMSWVLATLLRVAVFSVFAAAVIAWQSRRRPTWVRSSAAGVEIATRGSDPVFVGWADVISADVRRRGLVATVLEVAPADIGRPATADPDADLPLLRDTPNGPAYVAELSSVRPGPAALRAELARRLGGRTA